MFEFLGVVRDMGRGNDSMLSLMLIFRNFDWRYEERIDRGPACSGFVRVTGRLGSKGASSLTRWLKSLLPPPLFAGCHPACCLALRAFTSSYRDVEDLLAKRGLERRVADTRNALMRHARRRSVVVERPS